jgi:cytochrome P450
MTASAMRVSNVETLMVAITIMVAGNETTTNLIGNTVVELLANPDQLKLLLDDPGLLPMRLTKRID